MLLPIWFKKNWIKAFPFKVFDDIHSPKFHFEDFHFHYC